MFHGRFYVMTCVGVRPEFVASLVVATGEGKYVEARPIEALPTNRWLAVRGDLPCQPGPDGPHHPDLHPHASRVAALRIGVAPKARGGIPASLVVYPVFALRPTRMAKAREMGQLMRLRSCRMIAAIHEGMNAWPRDRLLFRRMNRTH